MVRAIIPLLLMSLVYAQDDVTSTHIKLYKKVSSAIVGIKGQGQIGSGVVVSAEGVILSSTTAAGTKGEADVYLKGHKKVKGRIVYSDAKLELAIVRISKDQVQAVIQMGDSDVVKVGQVAYTLGDSRDSIFTDDQVAFSVGVISAIYKLDEPKGGTYKGPVFETSAAVNPNQDGGALLDSKGNLVGMLSLSYHEARYEGVAIPVNLFKVALEWVQFGLELDEAEGRVSVRNVEEKSSAERAGFKKLDQIVKIGEVKISSIASFHKETLKAGKKIAMEIEREDGETKSRVKIDVDRHTGSN